MPERLQERPQTWCVNKAQDTGVEAEGAETLQSGEAKAQGRPISFDSYRLKLSDQRIQRR